MNATTTDLGRFETTAKGLDYSNLPAAVQLRALWKAWRMNNYASGDKGAACFNMAREIGPIL